MRQAPVSTVRENLARMEERIQAARERGGHRQRVSLVAITKTVPVERIAEAYSCGVRHFGENLVQEFAAKREHVNTPGAVWHFVGHLQTNKAKRALELFDRVDSVDRVRLAEKLSAAARERSQRVPVLLEVELGGEPSKHGVPPSELGELAAQVAALDSLQIEGLMAIPPWFDAPEKVRPYFRRLRQLAEEVNAQQIPGVHLRELSMGMSADFEVAIEEGATQIRLGTALFGPRPVP